MKKSNNKSKYKDSNQGTFNRIINDLKLIDEACCTLNCATTDMQETIDQLEATQFGLLVAAERLLADQSCTASPEQMRYLSRLRFIFAK